LLTILAFAPLQMPVTLAPISIASWTAVEPTAPDAPLIAMVWPWRSAALSRRKLRAVASTSAAASS
jgi:hypothetical protein